MRDPPSRQVRTTNDHQPTDLAIRRDLAHFGSAPRTEVPALAHRAVARAQADGARDREARGETHHHEVRGRGFPAAAAAAATAGVALGASCGRVEGGFEPGGARHHGRRGRLYHLPH